MLNLGTGEPKLGNRGIETQGRVFRSNLGVILKHSDNKRKGNFPKLSKFYGTGIRVNNSLNNDHRIFTMKGDKNRKKIPYKKKYLRNKLFKVGRSQTVLYKKKSLSSSSSILSRKSTLPQLSKSQKIGIDRYRSNSQNNGRKIKFYPYRKIENSDSDSENEEQEPIKKRLIRKIFPGKIFKKNKLYDIEQEQRIGELMEELKDNKFVKEMLEDKFDKFMNQEKAKKRLLRSWKMRNEIIQYENDKKLVSGLERWTRNNK